MKESKEREEERMERERWGGGDEEEIRGQDDRLNGP
jgi:hypothetical protein